MKTKILTSLPRIKEAFEDLKILRDIESTVPERIQKYLKEYGDPKEYDIEELGEKYLLIDWVACQLSFERPIKTKLLFLYGEQSTQKTLVFHFLSKVLKIDFASSRIKNFPGAHNHYDIWLFDEFHEPDPQSSIIGGRQEGTAFANTM